MEGRSEKVDLNQADAETLATLPGIGPALAGRIVAFRQTGQTFRDVAELTAVSGVSENLIQAIADLVTVGEIEGATGQDLPVTPASEQDSPAAQELEGTALANGVEGELAGQEQAAQRAPLAGVDEQSKEATTINADSGVAASLGQEETVSESVVAEAVDQEADGAGVVAEREQSSGDETDYPDAGDELEEPVITFLTPESEVVAGIGDAVDRPDGEAPEQPRIAPDISRHVSEPEPAEPGTTARGGCRGLGVAFLGGVLGAAIGTVLALSFLFWLNGGTLSFASATSASRLARELESKSASVQQEQEELLRQLNALNDTMQELSVETSDLIEQRATLEHELVETQRDLADLEETVAGQNERIGTLLDAAEDFDRFLVGLRSLLSELEPVPSATTSGGQSTLTPTDTPIRTVSPGTPSVTSTPPRATRTPRPTATPFGVPIATPAP